jgi:ABC-type transport system involved in cytochrome bd biosynthesis fused ATPase/permease subunit
MMVLPLALRIGLGSGFAALPVVAGFGLEILRSSVRRALKRRVRGSVLREAASGALDKRAVVPEADVESAFWAAHLTERAVAVDLPAVIAATLAGASIVALSAPAIHGGATAWLSLLVLSTLSLTIWSNRRHASAVVEVIARRQGAAGWVAAAERDAGEIYGERARAPFLAQLIDSAQLWSLAEEVLERRRLRARILLAALFAFGVLAILRAQHVDPFNLPLETTFSARGLTGVLLLSSGIPVAYVLAVHVDSLLAAYASLTQLLARPRAASTELQVLRQRPAFLTARSLRFCYPGQPRPVLVAQNFVLDLQRIALIVAPNGAGKTTLARLICGVLVPDGGTLEIDAMACCNIARDDFGFVPQNPLIVESLSIEANVRLVAPEATALAIDELLLDLGLKQPRHWLAGDLSRGEQRRIAIARAILKAPRLLLLDEPDVWLDVEGRARLARVLQRQLAQRAVIVVSHRREWLPDDAHVIELEDQSEAGLAARAEAAGKSTACG